MSVTFCKRCTFASIAATPLTFNEEGVCSGCTNSERKRKINWERRKELFSELIEEYRGKYEYDCILPVSGGKDSYFAAHIAKEFNLNALMVTYHGNNYMEEGEINLNRMKDVFGFDHIIFKPSTDTLKKLNLLGFTVTGDMNWHNHAGLLTYPMQIAVKYKVPIVIWGDHGFTEQGGCIRIMIFEYTAKDRYETVSMDMIGLIL